jgi:hypothetical protein
MAINNELIITGNTGTGNKTRLPVLSDVDYRAGTRPAKAEGSPSLASQQDAAAWASDVDSVFQNVLGRNAGAVGHQYWTYDLMQDTGALMEDHNKSFEEAKAMAISNMSANVGRSTEAQNYFKSGQANPSPLATGAGTWNPTNNPEELNAKWGGEGSSLVTNPDGSQTFTPAFPQQPAYTPVTLNQQPAQQTIQPAMYGTGGGGSTTIVAGTGPKAKTAADQLKITPYDKYAFAGRNRPDYNTSRAQGTSILRPPGQAAGGTGGVQILG